MKEWSKDERWHLAAKLEGVLGADLDADEEDAIRDAIRLICPEYAAMRDEDERDFAEWDAATGDAEKGRFIEEEMKNYPPKVNGKTIRFGSEDGE